MRISELYKPPAVDQLRQEINKSSDEDLHLHGWKKKGWRWVVQKLMKDHGFEKLGHGSYASVFIHPKYPFVLKLFVKDSGYLDWLRFVKANQNNPHVPKIRGGLVKITDRFYAVRLERLHPNWQQFIEKDASNQELEAAIQSWNRDQPPTMEFNSDVQAIVDALKAAEKKGQELDLWAQNIMVRDSDKKIVIVDPLLDIADLDSLSMVS